MVITYGYLGSHERVRVVIQRQNVLKKIKKGNQQDTAQAFQNPSCLQHLLCLGEDNNAAPTNESLLCCSTPTEVRTQRLHLHLHAIPWRQYIGYTQPEMTSDAWLDFPDMLHCAGLRWVTTQDFCLITERDASQGKKSNEKKKKSPLWKNDTSVLLVCMWVWVS